MKHSGALGVEVDINHLLGMRGLVKKLPDEIIESPVKANFKEGLPALDYFTSTRNTRKNLTEIAVKAASSGYLTRRLVDVAHGSYIVESDCGTMRGIVIESVDDGKKVLQSVGERVLGRVSCFNITDPITGDVLVNANEEITEKAAKIIDKSRVKQITIRSVLSCESKHGICAQCYGRDLSKGCLINIGGTVGVVAGQSIGEPLARFNLHIGTNTGDNITNSLARITAFFEVRDPENTAVISEIGGIVRFGRELKTKYRIIITPAGGRQREYLIPKEKHLLVYEGDFVMAGDRLTTGLPSTNDILQIFGAQIIGKYLLNQIQEIYSLKNIKIDDKHFEVILRKMLQRVEITNIGDSTFMKDEYIDWWRFYEENDTVIKEGGRPAQAKPLILGITETSLDSDSFISAASFQQTTRVLTNAAVAGSVDKLKGLKENVILGRLMPAGTGWSGYQKLDHVGHVPASQTIAPTHDSYAWIQKPDYRSDESSGNRPEMMKKKDDVTVFRIPDQGGFHHRFKNVDLDQREIQKKELETSEVQSTLASIFSDDDLAETRINEEKKRTVPSSTIAMLEEPYREFLFELIGRKEWSRQEMKDLSIKHKLLLDGAIENINEWSFGVVDDAIIDGDDAKVVTIDLELIHGILNEEKN